MTDTPQAGDSAWLAQAHAMHDADPVAAAALLREVLPGRLASGELPTYAFLLNHVLGEREGAWREALARHLETLDLPQLTPGRLRLAAAAACAAGDAAAMERLTADYAAAAQADPARAEDVVRLSAAACTVSSLTAQEASALTLDLLARMEQPAWQAASNLDAAVAACLNNLAGALQERPPADFTVAALRSALPHCAELAQRFWARAGTWVNLERALYLRATVATALGDFGSAVAHCREGLALIAAHGGKDPQFVDRAFLELELAHACERLGHADEASSARMRAELLAAGFRDAGLQAWFASRREALMGQAGPGTG